MDGVLVIDKPEGLTSHDVVAAARRALGQRRIGHTGTLDPLATGVLPLVIGRATRLVRFLSANDKDYEATIRFGITTDSYDITGAETGRSGEAPARGRVEAAIDMLRGNYLQTPPAFSAKQVDGRRAYAMARRDEAVALTPVPVRVDRVELLELTGDRARVALTSSAGFYVRTFAHTLGQHVGTGACLEALRRTRSGEFGLDEAVGVGQFNDQGALEGRIRPLSGLMRSVPAVVVSSRGRGYVSNGRQLGTGDYEPVGETLRLALHENAARTLTVRETWIRLLDSSGALIGLATPGPTADSLLPSIVLI